MKHLKFLGTNLTDQNSIHAEIKEQKSFYHSVQNFYLPVCYPKTVKKGKAFFGQA